MARCDGQVLVLHAVLGIFPGKRPRFVKNFGLSDSGLPRDCEAAVSAYVEAVKAGTFPAAEQDFEK